ncbi:hypothetical protein CcCBS67573_g06569 [Chytriomyces confervae]|uniref:MOSC domain-containing protein n=1 Tax=Chytriomyces confervae TaxID=246404 RepID=A0A507F250_9FUNG|nr:hypothetical protein CcCBS67573_g06569 [Chytriomyces confervae]
MWTVAVVLAQYITFALYPRKAKGLKVSRLFVHPVKSCGAVEVKSASIGQFGFELDRLWMVIDADDHTKFITQREFPSMVLVTQQLVMNGSTYAEGGSLILSAPGMEKPLTIKFRSSFKGLAKVNAVVWDHAVDGFDEGDEAANWWSKFLGKRLRLIVKDPNNVRALREKNTPTSDHFEEGVVPQTAFADGYPFLVANEESLKVVNSRLPNGTKPRKMENFRANIIVGKDGKTAEAYLPAFAEDGWKTIQVGNERLFIASLCTRCQVPGNDLELGNGYDARVSRTLMKFRRVDKGKPYEPCFGVNAISKGVGGVIRVGDTIEVVEDGVVHNGKVGIWRNS